MQNERIIYQKSIKSAIEEDISAGIISNLNSRERFKRKGNAPSLVTLVMSTDDDAVDTSETLTDSETEVCDACAAPPLKPSKAIEREETSTSFDQRSEPSYHVVTSLIDMTSFYSQPPDVRLGTLVQVQDIREQEEGGENTIGSMLLKDSVRGEAADTLSMCMAMCKCASLTQSTLSKLKDSSQKLNGLLRTFYSKSDQGKMARIDSVHSVSHSQHKQAMSALLTVSPHKGHQCTIYRKLTKQCKCLSEIDKENELLTHFSEDSDYSFSSMGEIIKNIKILKRFMNRDCQNAKTALEFLVQGLKESKSSEQLEIVEACTFADFCDVFEECTILEKQMVDSLYAPDGTTVQERTAELLYRLSHSTEGKKYLKMNSKIVVDAKLFMKPLATRCSEKAKNYLIGMIINIAESDDEIYANFVDEGMVEVMLDHLSHHHRTMQIEELHYTLKLLRNFSQIESGQQVFLKEYDKFSQLIKDLIENNDNRDLNSCVTVMLSNILSCDRKTVCSKCAGNVEQVFTATTEGDQTNTESKKHSGRVKFGETVSCVNMCLTNEPKDLNVSSEEVIMVLIHWICVYRAVDAHTLNGWMKNYILELSIDGNRYPLNSVSHIPTNTQIPVLSLKYSTSR